VIEFRQELVALCDADPCPSQVIQLNLQLFPLSRRIPKGPSTQAKSQPTAQTHAAHSRSAEFIAPKDPKP